MKLSEMRPTIDPAGCTVRRTKTPKQQNLVFLFQAFGRERKDTPNKAAQTRSTN
jgi:hypothetical protein